MKRGMRYILMGALAMAVAAAGLAPLGTEALAQRRTTARRPATPARPPSIYAQGYTKGYNDGFTQGAADYSNSAPRDFRASAAYQQREESFDARLAQYEQYRQGFDLGFEMGYLDGYYGRARSAAVPAHAEVLARAAALADAQRQREAQQPPPETRPREATPRPAETRGPARGAQRALTIPANTEMRIRLTSGIDTKNNRVGDRFTAEVLMPGQYEGAEIEGHIAKVDRSGRISGRTELLLSFDRIRLRDGREADIGAQLINIIESENVKKVDEEGNVQSGSRTRDSQVRGGVGAAAGAVIGGIVGGVKGAVLGAILGGGAGVGTVYIEGNKDLILDPGTEMDIRTDRDSTAR